MGIIRYILKELAFAILIVASFFLLIIIQYTSCPACKRPFVAKRIDSKQTGYGHTVRKIIEKEKNEQGKVVREWEKEQLFAEIYFLDEYECSHCHHLWTMSSAAEMRAYVE